VETSSMPTIRLRVTISVDVEATDFLEAAEHQKRLQTYLSSLRDEYPEAALSVRDRRAPRVERSRPPRAMHARSGKLNVYE
jgi:hypothetical protein